MPKHALSLSRFRFWFNGGGVELVGEIADIAERRCAAVGDVERAA
jgi:hypothetical protein